MAAVGSLVVRIGADTRGLRHGGDEAARTLGNITRQARATTQKLAAIATAAAAAGAAISVGLVRESGAAARELLNLSRVAGTTVSQFQRNAAAARTLGIENEKLADIYKDMRDRVGDFLQTGGGPMADFFENIAPKVGVTAEQFRHLSGPQALQLFYTSLERANISQSEMVFHMEAMASDATTLIPLLRDNGKAMQQLGDEAERAGQVMSDIDAQQLAIAGAQMEQVARTAEALKNQVAIGLAPVLGGMAQKISDAAKESGGFRDEIGAAIDAGVTGFGVLADGVHGFQVVLKGAQLAAQGLGTGMLSVISLIYEGWTRVSQQIVDSLRTAIGLANRLPGIEIPVTGLESLSAGMQAAADQQVALRERMRESFAQTAAELHELMMQPLPSDGIKAWVAEARALGQELAEDLASKAQVIAGAGGNGGSDASGGLDEAERERMQQRLQAIRESLMSEEQLERDSHQRKLEELALYRENELLSEAEHKTLREGLEQEHMDRLVEIRRRGMNAMQQFSAMSTAKQAKQVLGQLSQLTAGVASENKAMFEANKAFAISDAILSAYTGISKTLSAYPFPLSAAMAAAQAGVAFAQVRAISSQSFGSGGGAAPSLAGGTPAPPVTPVGGQSAGGGGEGGGRNIMISVQDDMLRAMITPIMNEIGEQLADGGRLGSLRVVS